MTYETIEFVGQDGVATITLNRPSTLNAFTDRMIAEATDAFRQCGRDHAVRCVVLTGAGRGFSSGQDLGDIRGRADFSIGDHLRQGYHRLIRQMVALDKPIVAAVNGIAAGAGFGVALAADIRLASDKAAFMLAFSRVGLIPDSGVNWFLPRLIGYGRAYELALTAERISAERALALGLVNRVVPGEQLPEVAAAFAGQLARGPALAYGLTKRAMLKSQGQSLDEALEYEAQLQELAGRSDDSREGIQAFLEKREPRFGSAT